MDYELMTDVQSEALAEMRATAGYKILEKFLKDKYSASAGALITDSSQDEEKITTNRARCKLIQEVFVAAGVNKEERKWKNLLL